MSKADPNSTNEEGCSLLADAVIEGQTSTVEILPPAGAHPNAASSGETTALYYAARLRQTEKMALLLSARAAVASEPSRTPRHAAAEAAHLDTLKFLRTASGQAALNRFDDFSRTPQMCAVRKGPVDAVRCLPQNGARTNSQDKERIGNTALRNAAAHPSQPRSMQLTALHKAKARTDPHSSRIQELLRQTIKSRQ